jgi:hypothetical protein
MGASEATPIPVVVGTYRIAGSIIWAGSFQQGTTGGKGVGSTQQSYTYSISFALLLCRGPIVGIRRIWMDKTLVYDRSEGVPDTTIAADVNLEEKMTVYLGDEEQLPDPTMQSYLGANNVPAHRGTAYIVFDDLDVTAYGARIPQIEVEVIQAGEELTPQTVDLSSDVLFPLTDVMDPRNCLNDHEYQGEGDWTTNLATALASVNASGQSLIGYSTIFGGVEQAFLTEPNELEVLYLHFSTRVPDPTAYIALNSMVNQPTCAQIEAQPVISGGYQVGTSLVFFTTTGPLNPGESASFRCPLTEPNGPLYYQAVVNLYAGSEEEFTGFQTAAELVALALRATQINDQSRTYTAAPILSGLTYSTANSGNLATITGEGGSGTLTYTISYQDLAVSCSADGSYEICPYDPNSCVLPCMYVQVYSIDDTLIKVRRVVRGPDNPCQPRCKQAYPTVPGDSSFCIIDGELVQSVGYSKVTAPSGQEYRWLSDYFLGNTTSTPYVENYPNLPVLAYGDPNDNQTYWENAYAAALTAHVPGLPSGMTYEPVSEADGLHYPVLKTYAWERVTSQTSLRPVPVSLADAITQLCELQGLTSSQIDVSSVTGSIYGYAVSRVTNARDSLLPLMTYGFIDAAEIDGKLTFVQRGGIAVATLTEDDLVMSSSGSGANSTGSTRAAITRAQDVELPRDVRVKYADVLNSYQDGQASAPRLIDTTVQTQDVQLAIAMTPTQARQIAEILLRAAWIGREGLPITVDASWLGTINPASAINLSLSGVERRYRVTTADYSFPSSLQLQLVREEEDAWTSIESAPVTGAVATSQVAIVGVQGPTQLLVLDIPALRSVDNAPGYYAAVRPYLTPWLGATIYRSVDGGVTFNDLVTASQTGTLGTVSNVLSAWPETVWDQTNSITVVLDSGTLSSSTINGLMNLANFVAYGADTRWEILQFKTATLNSDGSYTLTGLLRGLLGTEQYTGQHQAGDSFVLLTGSIIRLSDELSYMGASEILRAVTTSTALAAATNVAQTPREICLKPIAPVHLAGGRDAAGNVLMQWVRCDRFANDLVDGSDVPMSETRESYDLEIYDGEDYATVVRTFFGLTSPAATYTEANQVTDFGSAQSAVYTRVYQNSAQIGRGYPASATI